VNAAEIAALATGIPAIIGAITALVIALKGNSTANTAKSTAQNASTATGLLAHAMTTNTVTPQVRINPVTEQPETAEIPEVAPELTNPIGLQGASLMGVSNPVPAPEAAPAAPEEAPPVEATGVRTSPVDAPTEAPTVTSVVVTYSDGSSKTL
jgi:hypothetical protein